MTKSIDVELLLDRMCLELREHLIVGEKGNPLIIGIRTGGVWLAKRIREKLNVEDQVGELDISFYRDDFTRIGLNPRVSPSSLPVATEGRDIVLVDDVIMSGRTVRAAMNELFDFGRPDSITLVALVDLGLRELPIQADITGTMLALQPGQRIKLRGPQPLALEIDEAAAGAS